MGFLSRALIPRQDRHTVSANRPPVKRKSSLRRRTRLRRVMRRMRKALFGMAGSRSTAKRKPRSQQPVAVYHHGTCTVNHRTRKAAARCRRTY